VVGLCVTEVERRTLTGAQSETIVRAEVADRKAVPRDYEDAGRLERAERLRPEAKILSSYLGDTLAQRPADRLVRAGLWALRR